MPCRRLLLSAMLLVQWTGWVVAVSAQTGAPTIPGSHLWTFGAGPGSSGSLDQGGTGCQTYYGIDFAAPVLTPSSIIFMSEAKGWRTFAVDVATGVERWNVSFVGSTSATAPAVSDGAVYFAVLRASKVHLVCIDEATGRLRWDVVVPGAAYLYGPPSVAAGVVYIVLHDGLHTFSSSSGAQGWTATKPGCSETTPTVVDGVVYIAAGEGSGVQTFDASTGKPGWTSPPDTSSPWATPVVHGGRVFSSGFNNSDPNGYYTAIVYGLDSQTGKLDWKFDLAKFNPEPMTAYAPLAPAVADGRLFVTGAMSTVYALDTSTGALLWNATNLCNGHLWAVAAVVNGTVYVGCDEGTLYALAVTSGDLLWHFHTDAGAARSPVVGDGRVFFGATPQRSGAGKDALIALVASPNPSM
jgi:outer membrane protein assembly factor BamB